MVFKKLMSFLPIFAAMLFPSCIKYYEMSNKEFYQGKNLSDQREVSRNNLKTLAIHDQFTTLAIFNFLWLSDEIRNSYVEMNSLRRGKDAQAKMAALTRQLEENKHWISFYVLADVRDKSNGSLSEKNSQWIFYLLSNDNRKVAPSSIKEIEIEPEFKFLFGSKFNLFGRAYEVKFPFADISGVPYVRQSESFKLIACSPAKQAEVVWNQIDPQEEALAKKGKKRKIIKNEDFYWIGS